MADGKSDTTDDVVLAVLARIERKLDECLRYARMTDAERAFDAQYERWKAQAAAGCRPPARPSAPEA
jgi:hypothetical protein